MKKVIQLLLCSNILYAMDLEQHQSPAVGQNLCDILATLPFITTDTNPALTNDQGKAWLELNTRESCLIVTLGAHKKIEIPYKWQLRKALLKKIDEKIVLILCTNFFLKKIEFDSNAASYQETFCISPGTHLCSYFSFSNDESLLLQHTRDIHDSFIFCIEIVRRSDNRVIFKKTITHHAIETESLSSLFSHDNAKFALKLFDSISKNIYWRVFSIDTGDEWAIHIQEALQFDTIGHLWDNKGLLWDLSTPKR